VRAIRVTQNRAKFRPSCHTCIHTHTHTHTRISPAARARLAAFFLVAARVWNDNRRTRGCRAASERAAATRRRKYGRVFLMNSRRRRRARASMRTPVCGRVAFRTYARRFSPRSLATSITSVCEILLFFFSPLFFYYLGRLSQSVLWRNNK